MKSGPKPKFGAKSTAKKEDTKPAKKSSNLPKSSAKNSPKSSEKKVTVKKVVKKKNPKG